LIAGNRKKPPVSHHPQPFPRNPLAETAPQLNLAEQELHALVEQIGEGILQRSNRPEIELRILAFLTHATGASTEGIANEMGISVDAAAVHLGLLEEANRIWGQPAHGNEKAWHISQEGRHFFEEERQKTAS
jgi:hypothetical protein